MFKSQLQEYAQKARLPAPIYDTKKEGPSHEPQFKASVTVQGNLYESPMYFSNLKKAEHAAAEVALVALGKTETGAACTGSLHESGLCKNLLQEYAQKCKLPLPIYSVVKTGETHSPSFMAIVEIAGVHYKGGNCKTKKEAEIKAARTALVAIYANSGTSSLQVIEDHAPSVNTNTPSAPVEPSPAEPSSGTKRKKKFRDGNTGRKQKVKDEQSKILDEAGNGDVLQVGDDTETASEQVGDTKQANGCSSLPTGSADKGPEEQKLLCSAVDACTAANATVSSCGNGTALSVQSPHAQEQ